MKKYKLIKKLPFENSPEIGYISESKYNSQINHYWCGCWFDPSKYPEFWQPVVEKDYEILSLIEDKFIYPCDKYSKNYINQLFNTLGVSIHSVKRLSDGEIFTIGDKINCNCLSKKEINNTFISNFNIINNNIRVYDSFDEFHLLKDIQKAKQPLFTTENSVDIYEGDTFYYVKFKENRNSYGRVFEIVIVNRPGCIYEPQYEKYFSTKEKAEEYILYNKPLLTLKDIEELLCKNTSSYFLEKFKKRAQKLNNKN